MFTTKFEEILLLIDQIDPKKYAHTRNYGDGDITKLSPYISRGVISTKMIYSLLVEKGFQLNEMEAFVKELAWRDYFQPPGGGGGHLRRPRVLSAHALGRQPPPA